MCEFNDDLQWFANLLSDRDTILGHFPADIRRLLLGLLVHSCITDVNIALDKYGQVVVLVKRVDLGMSVHGVISDDLTFRECKLVSWTLSKGVCHAFCKLDGVAHVIRFEDAASSVIRLQQVNYNNMLTVVPEGWTVVYSAPGYTIVATLDMVPRVWCGNRIWLESMKVAVLHNRIELESVCEATLTSAVQETLVWYVRSSYRVHVVTADGNRYFIRSYKIKGDYCVFREHLSYLLEDLTSDAEELAYEYDEDAMVHVANLGSHGLYLDRTCELSRGVSLCAKKYAGDV